jgi:hypothetical protein
MNATIVGRSAAMPRLLALIFAVSVVLFPLAACSDESRLVLRTQKGEYPFTVEVVDTPEKRAEGLMFRQSLAPDAGMLFDFKETREVSFWMRNTFIPLDMVFIAADGKVESIHVNARPHDPTSIPSGAPVQYVLEIPGGRSAEIGLKPGDKAEHPRVKASM